jgi:hypothetical protein
MAFQYDLAAITTGAHDAARQTLGAEREREVANLQWQAGAAKFALDNNMDPDIVQALFDEGRRRGTIPDNAPAPQAATKADMLKLYQTSMVALGGAPAQEDERTSNQKDYEYYRKQAIQRGETPQGFTEWVKAMKQSGRPTTNIEMPAQYPAPAAGWMYEFGEDGVPTGQVAIPGGPADLEQQENRRLATERHYQAVKGQQFMEDEIFRAFERIAPDYAGGATGGILPAAGVGGQFASNLPIIGKFTAAGQLESILGTIKGRIGFEHLQRMREASPTGGALGQVSERELGFLQGVWGDMSAAQYDWQIAYNLMRYYVTEAEMVHVGAPPPPGASEEDRKAYSQRKVEFENVFGQHRIPERDFRILYQKGKDNPEIVKRFKEGHGWLPPGFEEGNE